MTNIKSGESVDFSGFEGVLRGVEGDVRWGVFCVGGGIVGFCKGGFRIEQLPYQGQTFVRFFCKVTPFITIKQFFSSGIF